MPLTWEKGSQLPPGTTKLGNLRGGHDSVTAPTAKQDLGFSSSVLGEYCSVEPTQGGQKFDRLHMHIRNIIIHLSICQQPSQKPQTL